VRLLVLLVNNELEKMWMEVVVVYNSLVGLNTTEGLRRTDIPKTYRILRTSVCLSVKVNILY